MWEKNSVDAYIFLCMLKGSVHPITFLSTTHRAVVLHWDKMLKKKTCFDFVLVFGEIVLGIRITGYGILYGRPNQVLGSCRSKE